MDLHHRPCHTCGDVISRADLQQRGAVIVMKRAYCRSCAARITASARPPGTRPRLYAAAAITVGLVALIYFIAVHSLR